MKEYETRLLKTGEMEDFYRLRHRIYCEELNYEPINDCGEEIDLFDLGALAYGLFHGEELVGGFRLLTGRLQIEDKCNFEPLANAGEISRFCITEGHRKLKTIRGLSKMCVAAGLMADLDYGYALMESSLFCATKALGFPWEKVADFSDLRSIYRLSVREAAVQLILKKG